MLNNGLALRFHTLLAVASSLGLLIALPLALGKVYVHDDLSYYTIPLRSYFAQCLASGQDPSWCPGLFGGLSLYGEGGGFAHPMIQGFYAFLPLGAALNLDVIWPYPLMVVGFALLLMRWGLPRDAATFGGLIYAFGGQNLLQYIHTSVSSLLGHLPWVLLCIDVAIRSEDRRRVALARIALAILTASELLIGHVQFLWISMLGQGLYALFLVRGTPRAWRPWTGVAVSIGLGILAGSLQLLPTWEAFRESRREQPSLVYVATGSLPPINLMHTIAPYLTRSRVMTPPMATDEGVLAPAESMFDWRVHQFSTYLGASIPVLLVWLVLARRQLAGRLRSLAWFALGLSVFSLILSFGDYTPLFGLTIKIPVVGRFRIPSRYLMLYQVAGAILAALAFATLAIQTAPTNRIPWKRLWPLGLPFALSLLFALASGLPEGTWPSYLRGAVISPPLLVAIGPILVGLATALVALAARGWRMALPTLVVLTGIDLAAYGIHANLVNPERTLAAYTAPHELPANVQDGTRVAHTRLHMTWQNPYLMQGLRTMQGYVSLMPRRALTYDTPNSMRVAEVGWISQGGYGEPQTWVKAPAPPLPRARLVSRTQTTTDPRQDLERIDPATTVLTDRDFHLPEAPPGLAQITRDRPGKIDIRTESGTRQMLVVSEGFHGGWTAQIDGRPARLVRAYGDLIGCVVPKGQHRVSLRFVSQGRQVGAWMSLVGVILAVAVPLVPLVPRRTSTRPPTILLGPKQMVCGSEPRLARIISKGDDSHG